MPPDEVFEQERGRLVGIAYRMLGSRAEAEDVVQDVWLRWHRHRDGVDDPPVWLRTVTSRLCLDHLRSAKVRREEYVGTWLPEPVPDDEALPADAAELADTLSYALLAVMEQLAPAERVAYLLREAFDAPYSEIAEVLGKSEVACRQLVSRARRKVTAARPRLGGAESSRREERERLVEGFLDVARTGRFDGLVEILDPEVVLYSDGGGKALAALRPIYGRDKVVRLFEGLAPKAPADFAVLPATINGEPGLVGTSGGLVVQTFSFEVADGKAVAIYSVRNPDKLTRVQVLGGVVPS